MNTLFFYIFIVVIAFIFFVSTQYRLRKSGMYKQFTMICTEGARIEQLLSQFKKKIYFTSVCWLVAYSYAMYCEARLLYELNMWNNEIIIGFVLQCIYVIWGICTYAAAKSIVERRL